MWWDGRKVGCKMYEKEEKVNEHLDIVRSCVKKKGILKLKANEQGKQVD